MEGFLRETKKKGTVFNRRGVKAVDEFRSDVFSEGKAETVNVAEMEK